ncbi:hypothetical protein RFI_10305 [Reticulomyxa filosa]|uniref:CAP-Gly domain-containing protein n=1 Tax=Reticulomyxa filosa TaxID=46433 RepID=X6NN60_RETFI|nr:hypothetical protein RFI_10305 [Reticulomyxa filosa]|eukprot:ETO26832.1 hypothetical protein RFI_10305 [Reticulomyxa filosa]
MAQKPAAKSVNEEIYLGDEVIFISPLVTLHDTKRGIVRFVGPMEDKSVPTFYGVELKSGVGKNDGTSNGQKFFECGPNKGIFTTKIKISKTKATPESKLFPHVTVGSRVNITAKKAHGVVRYIGHVSFDEVSLLFFFFFDLGLWIGVELDEANGENNGTIKERSYFKCKDSHGIFVRSDAIEIIVTYTFLFNGCGATINKFSWSFEQTKKKKTKLKKKKKNTQSHIHNLNIITLQKKKTAKTSAASPAKKPSTTAISTNAKKSPAAKSTSTAAAAPKDKSPQAKATKPATSTSTAAADKLKTGAKPAATKPGSTAKPSTTAATGAAKKPPAKIAPAKKPAVATDKAKASKGASEDHKEPEHDKEHNHEHDKEHHEHDKEHHEHDKEHDHEHDKEHDHEHENEHEHEHEHGHDAAPAEEEKSLQEEVHVGDKVVIKPDKMGQVKYVGEADNIGPGIWFGIRLVEKKGECDGEFRGHEFFQCPQGFGVYIQQHAIVRKLTSEEGAHFDFTEEEKGIEALKDARLTEIQSEREKLQSVVLKFKELDTDGNQMLDRQEFSKLAIETMQCDPRAARELFATVDRNGSGHISLAEFKAWVESIGGVESITKPDDSQNNAAQTTEPSANSDAPATETTTSESTEVKSDADATQTAATTASFEKRTVHYNVLSNIYYTENEEKTPDAAEQPNGTFFCLDIKSSFEETVVINEEPKASTEETSVEKPAEETSAEKPAEETQPASFEKGKRGKE